ncbi:MAG: demethoxyubiquinone hydroxylase family protein [Pseudomonadota bacterium]
MTTDILTADAAIAETLPAWLVAELRTDHAGETGAVAIYKGALAVTKSSDIIAFSQNHLRTETSHLREIETLIEPAKRSRLTPIWWALGWITGAFPALLGPRAFFATIEAVETFVDEHYQDQIDRLDAEDRCPEIRNLLDRLRLDEVAHRDDAHDHREGAPIPALLKPWLWLVDKGSRSAVAAARVI